MKKLSFSESHFVSGARATNHDALPGVLLDISLTALGAYLGFHYLSYCAPLLVTITTSPIGVFTSTTYNPSRFLDGAILGGAVGFALSQTIQLGYNHYFYSSLSDS